MNSRVHNLRIVPFFLGVWLIMICAPVWAGPHYFAATSVSTSGVESKFSNEAVKEAADDEPIHLNWTAPTKNSDGSPLTDLGGYRIYHGTVSGSYVHVVSLTNPKLTSYVWNSSVVDQGGFKVVDGTAFTISQSHNVFTIYPVGSVAIGTPCDPDQTAWGKHRVSVESVAIPPDANIELTIAFAECVDSGN